MDSMIHIGAVGLKDAATPIGDAILEIITAEASDEVKREALKTFAAVTKVENVVVSNNTFTGDRTFDRRREEE